MIVPSYWLWLIIQMVAFIASLIIDAYYIYMGTMPYQWLYTLARNNQFKDYTAISFWFSIAVNAINFLQIPLAGIFLGINYLTFNGYNEPLFYEMALYIAIPALIQLGIQIPQLLASVSLSTVMQLITTV